MKYYLRPHHSLCIQFFCGNGYSPEFIKNMQNTINTLDKYDPLVYLTDKCDIICSTCPNNQNGKCISDEKVKKFDDNVLKATSLSTGSEIRWKTLRELAKKEIILKAMLPEICRDCQWLNICTKRNRADDL